VKFKYPPNFWLICVAMLLFMISFNLIIPEMNEFITKMGGANHKGLIITLFSISAMISRPFSGKLSDTIGRKKVMIIGIVIGGLVTLLYPLFGMVSFFLFLRFMHGFSAGFAPTGATALITDVLPQNKRGVGMGIWGVFFSVGMGIGQALGSPIKNALGMNSLFFISAISAGLAVIMVMMLKETLPNPIKFKFSLLKITWKDVLEPSVIPAFIVMTLSAAASGMTLVITPEISGYLGIENKGWFFLFYVISTMLVRLFASGVSDIIGRRKTLIMGMSLLTISLIMVATANTVFLYTASAVTFGFATGITSPTLFAWTADLSHPERRGIGSGTLFIGLELGVMIGSASTLLTYQNTFASVGITLLPIIILSALSIFYLIWHLKFRESIT
jgi:MFS family permease